MGDKVLKESLYELAEPDFQKFSSSLLPGIENIIGVRLPKLRKIAVKLARGDWKTYVETASEDSFEEIMLQGMVIGYINTDVTQKLSLIANFVPKINNWSVCDSFCSGLKFTKEYKNEVWKFISIYFSSDREYEIRFFIVMFINYYIDEEHINKVFYIIDKIRHEGYYVKMASAWAISVCFIKFPEITIEYLKCNRLDDFTYNKCIQKITESLVVDKETKKVIRLMKRD